MVAGKWVVVDSAEKQVGVTHVASCNVFLVGNLVGAFVESCYSRILPRLYYCKAGKIVSVFMLDKPIF